jgi:hypothetical protein
MLRTAAGVTGHRSDIFVSVYFNTDIGNHCISLNHPPKRKLSGL